MKQNHQNAEYETRGPLWVRISLAFCAAITLSATLALLGILVYESASFFGRVPLVSVLGDLEWTPLSKNPSFGIWPLLSGTLWSIVIALITSVPSGIFLAMCMSEIASPRLRRWLRPMMDVLSGIPAVAYGLFAFTFVTPALQWIHPHVGSFNMLSAGIVLGLMILPMITSLCEDAMQWVPERYRESARGLGASPLSIAIHVIIPASLPGIIGAIFLALSRALGETLVVAMAAGTIAHVTLDPTESMQTLSSFLLQNGLTQVTGRGEEQHLVFAVGLLLFVITLFFYEMGRRFSLKYKGSFPE